MNYIVSGIERSGTSMMMQILHMGGAKVAFDMFVKITAYGLKFLPEGQYRIIYMMRDLDEVMDSMEKMSGPIDRENEKPVFEKLNSISIKLMEERDDIDYIIMNYRDVIKNPVEEIEKLNGFLGGMLNVESAVGAVDPNLYRNIKNKE